MVKREGFGAIDLLIGLLVMAAIFFVSANVFKGVSTIKSPSEVKSIQQKVGETVNEIENMRRQSIDYQKNIEY